MKQLPPRSAFALCILTALLALIGCKDQKPQNNQSSNLKSTGDTASPNQASNSKSTPDSTPAATITKSTSTSHGLVVEGEHFTLRKIEDRQQNLTLAVFQAPEKWRDQSQVVWNYAHVSNPVFRTLSVENPDNDEALFAFPAARYFTTRPNYGLSHPGQNSLGLIEAEPVPPLQALTYFIRLSFQDNALSVDDAVWCGICHPNYHRSA